MKPRISSRIRSAFAAIPLLGASLIGAAALRGADVAVTTEASQDVSNKSWDTTVDNLQKYGGLSAAISAIGSNTRTLLIPQPVTVSASVTVPVNVTLQFWGSGRLNIASGATVTINGRVVSDRRQIFGGDGLVSFVPVEACATEEVYPEWWGALPDPGLRNTDSTAGLQAAINAVAGWRRVSLGSGVYMFSNLTLPAVTYLIGQGNHVSILMRKPGSTGIGITDSGNAAKITLQDFSIYANQTVGTALELGFNWYKWGTEGLIRRVMVRDSGGDGVRLNGNVAFIENLYVQSCVGTQFYLQGEANIISFLQVMGDYDDVIGVEIAACFTKIYGLHLEGIFDTPLLISSYSNTIYGCTVALSPELALTDVCRLTTNAYYNSIQDLSILTGYDTTVDNAITDLYLGRQYSPESFGSFVNYSQYSKNPLGVTIVSASTTLPNDFENQTIIAEGLTSDITINLPQLAKSYDHVVTIINNSPTHQVTVNKSPADAAGTKVAGVANSISLTQHREFLALSPTETEWLSVANSAVTSVNASTGTGTVKMGNGTNANSAGWMAMRRSDGTKVYVPYWTNPTP